MLAINGDCSALCRVRWSKRCNNLPIIHFFRFSSHSGIDNLPRRVPFKEISAKWRIQSKGYLWRERVARQRPCEDIQKKIKNMI